MRYVWIVIVISILLGVSTFIFYISELSNILVFVLASLDIIFFALLLGWSTEVISSRAGPTFGGFLNASLGNGAELIIGILGIKNGLYSLVKASITGAIVTNLLVVTGISAIVGGIRFKNQKFSANMSANNIKLMAIALTAMILPSIFSFTADCSDIGFNIYQMSLLISILIIILYFFNLFFVFKTHKHLFRTRDDRKEEKALLSNWSTVSSISLLCFSSIGIFLIADILIESIRPTLHTLGWNEIFLGVIIIGIIGNAAENSSAIYFGFKNNMNLSFSIVTSSSQQIALFVAPLLVILGYLFGWRMDLNFTSLEVIGIGVTTLIFGLTTIDGETNWLEGTFLMGIFLILAIVFFFA